MCPFTHTDEYDAYVVCGCNNKCWRGKMKLCVQMTSDDEEEERFSDGVRDPSDGMGKVSSK